MTWLNLSGIGKRIGAIADLWAMLRRVADLMRQPARAAEAETAMTATEIEAARSTLARALMYEPAHGLTVDDFDITRIFDASGAFNPDFALKPHILAARRQAQARALADNRRAWREHYLRLRHIRLVKKAMAWRATLQNIPWFTSKTALATWRERNRADAGRRAPTCVRARAHTLVAPLVLVPP